MYNPNTNGIIQKGMGLSEFATYLKEEMGLAVVDEEWSGAGDLPLFLAKAARYRMCSCSGVAFIVAEIDQEASLPELKRIASQVSVRANLPVVLVSRIDARQRKALVSQGIPFVVPGRQAFLPMLGFVASARRDALPLAKTLAPSTQAVLVALLANPEIRTSEGLMKVTHMPSSTISRAVEDLARRGLVEKGKEGRTVIIDCKGDRNSLVRSALGCLRNPVVRTVHAKRDTQTDRLPRAGESALSERSMLAPPKTEQRAVSREAFGDCVFAEVLPGELGDDETVEIQVWLYDPLVAGGDEVDDVSLALSLVGEEDERVTGQLNAMFKEELWQ